MRQNDIPLHIHHLSAQIATELSERDERKYDVCYAACLRTYSESPDTKASARAWVPRMMDASVAALQDLRDRKVRQTPRVQPTLNV